MKFDHKVKPFPLDPPSVVADEAEYGEFVLPPPVSKEDIDTMILANVDKLWSQYDKNENGYLEKEEALEFIRNTITDVASDVAQDDEAIEQAFQEFDVDGNGRIAKPEMINYIRKVMTQATE